MSDWTDDYTNEDWSQYFSDESYTPTEQYFPVDAQEWKESTPQYWQPAPTYTPVDAQDTAQYFQPIQYYAPQSDQPSSVEPGYRASVPVQYSYDIPVTDTSSLRELGVPMTAAPVQSTPGYGPQEEKTWLDTLGDGAEKVGNWAQKNSTLLGLLGGIGAGGLKILENIDTKKQRGIDKAEIAAREAPIIAKQARYEAPIDVGAYLASSRKRVAVDPGLRDYTKPATHSQLYFTPPTRNFGQAYAAEQARPMATGGAVGGLRQASRAVPGRAGGQSDKVKALLSPGEYVMDADTVSSLGDGSTDSGAAKLDQMRAALRTHKRSAPSGKIPPQARQPMQYMKGRK